MISLFLLQVWFNSFSRCVKILLCGKIYPQYTVDMQVQGRGVNFCHCKLSSVLAYPSILCCSDIYLNLCIPILYRYTEYLVLARLFPGHFHLWVDWPWLYSPCLVCYPPLSTALCHWPSNLNGTKIILRSSLIKFIIKNTASVSDRAKVQEKWLFNHNNFC